MSIFGSTRRPPRWKPVLGTPINGGHPLVRQMVLCLLCNEGAGKILKNSVFPVVDGILSNIISVSTSAAWDHLLAWKGRGGR